MLDIFLIPDTQCKEGVPMEHLEAAGNYIVERQPKVIVHIGDHYDMPSLSSYENKASKYWDDKDYGKDIEAGLEGMETLLGPMMKMNARRKRSKKKAYKPKMVFTSGNHEFRLDKALHQNPALKGAISTDHFKLKEFGWEAAAFTEIVVVGGVSFSHYFYHPNNSKPYTSVPLTRLKEIGFSFTMGHQQGLATATRYLANGQIHKALIAGSFYQHEEAYKGPQGNEHWRGCIHKTNVVGGNYDTTELSLDYLMREWL